MRLLVSILARLFWCTMRCSAIGCTKRCISPKIFCARHWEKVPLANKEMLFQTYGKPEFFRETHRAVASVAIMEEKMSYEEAAEFLEAAERTFESLYPES